MTANFGFFWRYKQIKFDKATYLHSKNELNCFIFIRKEWRLVSNGLFERILVRRATKSPDAFVTIKYKINKKRKQREFISWKGDLHMMHFCKVNSTPSWPYLCCWRCHSQSPVLHLKLRLYWRPAQRKGWVAGSGSHAQAMLALKKSI